MIDRVKLALRVSGNAFDAEINGYINACLDELRALGITNLYEGNGLNEQVFVAVIAYVKWHFGSAADKDDWRNIYAGEVAKLQIMSGHTEY